MRKPIPPMDLMFFLLESPQSPKHVAAVQVFKKPKNAPDTYLRDLVAAFKAAPVVAPFNYYPHFPRMGMPEWRVQEDMDMDYHVRHSAVPGPGSDEQLMEVIQRLHAGMLDRRRPGWICQVIEGLENDRFAVYSKIHHAYIDGMTGVKRMYGALSTSSRTRKIVPPWSYELERPSSAGKRRDSDPLKPILKRLRGLGEVTGLLSDMGLQWLNVREGKAQIPYSATPTLLNKPLEWETRSTAVCTLPLDRVKAIGKERGCTVNEVVLAIIDAALHDYLQRLGESTGDPLIALCPMSVRSNKSTSKASSQLGAVHVKMGGPDMSVEERLQQVMESSHHAKEQVSGMSSEGMVDFVTLFLGSMELLNKTKLDRLIAPSCNVLVSNVPGPKGDNLYLRGSKLEASYPLSALLPGLNLNTTLVSHGNSLDFGLLGDRHSLPDLGLVAERMEHHFKLLDKKVLGRRKSPARKKTAGKKRGE
jgi:diacylglycerol O-acyltransferase / wax synthase